MVLFRSCWNSNYAIVGGLTPVYHLQIGEHSLVGGGLRVVQDIPPYIIANGQPLKFSINFWFKEKKI